MEQTNKQPKKKCSYGFELDCDLNEFDDHFDAVLDALAHADNRGDPLRDVVEAIDNG
jgi:hypothetical protein